MNGHVITSFVDINGHVIHGREWLLTGMLLFRILNDNKCNLEDTEYTGMVLSVVDMNDRVIRGSWT